MDDTGFVYLNYPLHANHFPGFEIPEDLKKDLLITLDGGIHAVRESLVKHLFDVPEIRDFRVGYSKGSKRIDVKTVEDFLKVMAIMAEL